MPSPCLLCQPKLNTKPGQSRPITRNHSRMKDHNSSHFGLSELSLIFRSLYTNYPVLILANPQCFHLCLIRDIVGIVTGFSITVGKTQTLSLFPFLLQLHICVGLKNHHSLLPLVHCSVIQYTRTKMWATTPEPNHLPDHH